MAGSGFGTIFTASTWGESHGKGVGVSVDGCPSGLPLCEADIQKYLDRRRPGRSGYSTPRSEADRVEILSGVFEGKTTGTPISLMVRNTDRRSKDYAEIARVYRPGHADYTFDAKYGFRDYRGGGRSSGRETVGRVAAGAIAAKILGTVGISFLTYTRSVGPIGISEKNFDAEQIAANPLFMPDADAADDARRYLDACILRGDSCGGIVECVITGVPAGLGEPVFEKLDANLAKAVLSVGAVRGFEIGSGFSSAQKRGSENNDAFCAGSDGKPKKQTNHAGGTLGGISDGAPIVFRAAVKPTPSVSHAQRTVTADKKATEIRISGRHDPVIAPRAVVVIESMAALTLADALLLNMSSRMEYINAIYPADGH